MGYQLPVVPNSITIAGHTVALGGSQTLAASDLTNGTTGSGDILLATSPVLAGVVTFPDGSGWGASGINGALIGAGTPEAANFTTLIASGTIIATKSATSGPQFDTSGAAAVTVASGSSATIYSGSSSYFMVVILDPTQTADMAIYLIGDSSATATMVYSAHSDFVAPTTTPTSGHMSIGWSGSSWAIYNNQGNSINFRVTMFKVG